MSKKTVQLIVNSGNDYLVGVKANQPKLLHHFQQVTQKQTPISVDTQLERTRGRVIERTVQVYDQVSEIDPAWEKARSMIVVHRQGIRDGQPFKKVSYYLSSLEADAITFGLGIRGHRDIENGLHARQRCSFWRRLFSVSSLQCCY